MIFESLILKNFAEEGMFKGENYRYIVLKKQFYTQNRVN
jgi:hypothetical protein